MINVSAMCHNVIPKFIMREEGINVRNNLKFQVEDPSIKDHAAHFSNDNLRITLKLYGIISCFTSKNPSIETLNESDKSLFLTPSSLYHLHKVSRTEIEDRMLYF